MIRPATVEDIPAILPMAEKFWSLTAYDVPFDPGSATTMLQWTIDLGLCLVLDIEGPKGFVMGAISPLMANHAYTVGSELAWWVEPEYRSGRNGQKLMEGIEQAAKVAGVDFWHMMSLEKLNPEVAEKIYLRAGYEKAEHTFLKVL